MNVLPTLVTSEQLEVLKAQKILTSLDFVQCNNERLANIMGCNVSQVVKIHEKILAANNSHAVRSDRLLNARMKNTSIIEIGIPEVDRLLEGGLHCGTVTEVYGHSGSGKTHLAMQLSAHSALNRCQSISYLTTGGSDAKHLLKLMQSSNTNRDASFYKEALQRISFTHVTDVYQLMECLWNPDVTSRFDVVIIDSLASVFAPILGDLFNDYLSLLNKVASDLKRLAVVHRCAVLVVNHVANRSNSAEFNSTPLPALGRYWSSVPNIRLYMSRPLSADASSAFELTIVRNVNGPIQKKCSFSFPL